MPFRDTSVTVVAAVVLFAVAVGSTVRSQTQDLERVALETADGLGVPDTFLVKYLEFRKEQMASRAPHVLRVPLGYVKGLSRSFTAIAGMFVLDLESGAYKTGLRGLTPKETYGVWLVDTASDGTTSDAAYRLAAFVATASSASIGGDLSDARLPEGFAIDRVVVASGGRSADRLLAAGSANVFQKILLRRLTLVDESNGATLFAESAQAPALADLVPTLPAERAGSRSVPLDTLIKQGARLFNEATFGGNGRTCATCHPASNNFTIDTDFIASLPPDDPLFVAEFNPDLAQLERPALMRSYGLILENVDGLEDPTSKFVMRSVPHTLGLQVSLTRDEQLEGAPAQMTGWSGDGAPGTGSLREFAIGAVTQHFPRTLNRIEGRDFRLPNDHQLDAMEAFQLSLGRSEDFDLTRITFLDPNVATGQRLFVEGTGDPNAGGRCANCHGNAGALNGSLLNRNFNTNVEDVFHPARLIEDFPVDGGFGRDPSPDGTFGNRTFNTAPVVEAADTAPFFHHNVVDTLEGVVDFYSGPEFNASRAPSSRFSFTQTQRDQLADFMRGINTLQNVDVARRELGEILAHPGGNRHEQDRRLQTAFDDTQDAIDVLTDGGLLPAAVPHLVVARTYIAEALYSSNPNVRRARAELASAALMQARETIAIETP